MNPRYATLLYIVLFLSGVRNLGVVNRSVAGETETAQGRMWVYVAGDGIHTYHFNLKTGEMTPRSVTREANPSFLAIHPNGHYLYGAGKALSAFAIDPVSGALTLLNQVPCEGYQLCHLVVDDRGTNVLSASYDAGTVSVHRIGQDGRLGDRTALEQHEGSSLNESRQKAPHAHSINLDPHNHFAFAADLGIDKIVVYRFDASHGFLERAASLSVSVKPGAGPRHFTFHPHGHFAYVINGLDSTIGAFRYDAAAGRLKEIETSSTLPTDFAGENYTAEVVVEPRGRFLYGSNRGHNSIVVFSIDPVSGSLTSIQHVPTGGKWPRNFCIDPTGQYLLAANQQSDNVVVFRMDPQTGKLTPTQHITSVRSPACIRFLQQ